MRDRPLKIRQAHGGALYAGGVPGNRGGGRPRSVTTQRAGETLEDVIGRIQQVVQRQPDTCPHCGGAVEKLPELGLSETVRILATLMKGLSYLRSAPGGEGRPFVVTVAGPAYGAQPGQDGVGEDIDEG